MSEEDKESLFDRIMNIATTELTKSSVRIVKKSAKETAEASDEEVEEMLLDFVDVVNTLGPELLQDLCRDFNEIERGHELNMPDGTTSFNSFVSRRDTNEDEE